MSRPQFHSTDLFILRHAWLSLRDKHMLLAGSTRKLHSSLFVVVHSFYNGRRRRRDGRRWPPPRSPWPPCRWLGKYCYSSFLSSSSSFSPCRYGVHVWRHHRFPFLRGRGATISCGQVSPLGCIVARVGSPIKAPTCAASATVGGRSSPFAAL